MFSSKISSFHDEVTFFFLTTRGSLSLTHPPWCTQSAGDAQCHTTSSQATWYLQSQGRTDAAPVMQCSSAAQITLSPIRWKWQVLKSCKIFSGRYVGEKRKHSGQKVEGVHQYLRFTGLVWNEWRGEEAQVCQTFILSSWNVDCSVWTPVFTDSSVFCKSVRTLLLLYDFFITFLHRHPESTRLGQRSALRIIFSWPSTPTA